MFEDPKGTCRERVSPGDFLLAVLPLKIEGCDSVLGTQCLCWRPQLFPHQVWHGQRHRQNEGGNGPDITGWPSFSENPCHVEWQLLSAWSPLSWPLPPCHPRNVESMGFRQVWLLHVHTYKQFSSGTAAKCLGTFRSLEDTVTSTLFRVSAFRPPWVVCAQGCHGSPALSVRVTLPTLLWCPLPFSHNRVMKERRQ